MLELVVTYLWSPCLKHFFISSLIRVTLAILNNTGCF